MIVIACVDGGLFCIPLAILTAAGLGWCARCIRKMCSKDSCTCECHEQDC